MCLTLTTATFTNLACSSTLTTAPLSIHSSQRPWKDISLKEGNNFSNSAAQFRVLITRTLNTLTWLSTHLSLLDLAAHTNAQRGRITKDRSACLPALKEYNGVFSKSQYTSAKVK